MELLSKQQNMNIKKLFLLSSLVLLIISCTKSSGNLSGNVYWKYNDSIGNKPDSGTTIKLYSIEGKSVDANYSVTTDINGNFKIENIEPGSYLLVANSKNTVSSPRTLIENLQAHERELKLWDFNIGVYISQIEQLGNLKLLTDLSANDPAEYEKHSDELNSRISSIIQSFPKNFKDKLSIESGYDNSIFIKEIKINDTQNTIENIDFGFKNN